MRKQALFHLHHLCYLVATEVSEEVGDVNHTLDEYDDLEVHHQAIYFRKQQHLEATQVLVNATTDQIERNDEVDRPSENAVEEARAG